MLRLSSSPAFWAAPALLAALVALPACSGAQPTSSMPTDTLPLSALDNPLLQPFDGPYAGVPAFDEMTLADLEPALEAGIAAHLAEIESIAQNPAPPTFDNTIVALERSGEAIDRVYTYYGIWSSNRSSPEFREIQSRTSAMRSAYASAITQNDALFQRVAAVHASDEAKTLRPDQQRLVQLTYDSFARNGATLSGAKKDRYAAINARLSELQTQFANNILGDEEAYALYLTGDQLGGLPESFVNAAAAAATERGRDGEYAVLNTRSSMDPFLTYSTERDLREKVWTTYYSRGDNGDARDNNALITEILQLRDERVGLLGYNTYAEWRLEDRMAKTPERARELLEAVWPAATARVQEEVADMQALADQQGAAITIRPWDYRFYAEQVRQDRYALDSDEVKGYLQLDRLRESMFYVAGELFGYQFTPVADGAVPVFHPDVKVWEVTSKEGGDLVGLWYLDPFARQGKRSGAWATTYRSRDGLRGAQPVLASNNSNFVQPAPGEPVLVSWDDATTFFHEFGHALHFLAADVAYPSLNGGVRDYTEFQSQLLERWLSTDEVTQRFLVHHETGQPMPAALIAKIKKAATFNEGFKTTEYLASALMDLAYHSLDDPSGLDPDAFERETLAALGMPKELVMRHRSPQFGHVFSSEGYATGYYGYMWADVLTADAAEAFADAPGGFYDRELGARLVETLFAPRNAMDPADAYRAFRGRDAGIEPLMRARGFPVPDGRP